MRWPWQRKPEQPHLRAGVWGEKLAERMLEGKGYRILGRRVRVGTRDELDLVARSGDVLVFVEVNTRAGEEFGRPIESVDRAKRHALSRAAIRYLKKLRRRPDYFRFDVVEVIGQPPADPEIRHIENAFNLDPMYRIPW
jgi:putative endonuclease